MTNSIPVNNAIKLVKITLTEEMLEDAYWLNVFCQYDDCVGDVQEILYATNKSLTDREVPGMLEAINAGMDTEYNDVCRSDEEDYEAGDTVWALVDNK